MEKRDKPAGHRHVGPLVVEMLIIDEKDDKEILTKHYDHFGINSQEWAIRTITWALANGYSVQLRPKKN